MTPEPRSNDTLTEDATPALPAEPGTGKVLVVDDEEDIRNLLRSALEELGQFEVYEAENGREALLVLRERPIDLVITDLKMPEMGGHRLLEISRTEFPGVPVVVITGYAAIDTVVEVLRLGAANFIGKPFRLADICEIATKAIQRKRDRELPHRVLTCLAKETLSFSIPPLYETKTGALHYLTEKLLGVGLCDDSSKYFVTVSLDEAITNAIFYGCLDLDATLRETEPGTDEFNSMVEERMADPKYRKRAIRIDMELTRDRVVYRIEDPGPGFNPPDLSKIAPEDAGLSSLHGRGLLLVSCFMDEVSFNEKGNAVTLVKNRPAEEEAAG